MHTIRILEPDNNARGDLFGRLMADLFVALGYEQPAILIIAYYRRRVDDTEIINHAQQWLYENSRFNSRGITKTLRELLKNLGAPVEAETIEATDS